MPTMRAENFRRLVTRHPGAVVATWLLIALVVGLTAPSLTRLAAEGQANLLPKDAESVRVGEVVARAWPEQSYQSMAVVVLERPAFQKLREEDLAFARRLASIAEGSDRPKEILRVMGPGSPPEVASRMISRDGT